MKRSSVPVMQLDEAGRACWLEFGKDTYRHEPELERIWKARNNTIGRLGDVILPKSKEAIPIVNRPLSLPAIVQDVLDLGVI